MTQLPTDLTESRSKRSIRKWKRFAGILVLWFCILTIYVSMQPAPADETRRLVLSPEFPALMMFKEKTLPDGKLSMSYLPRTLEIESRSTPITVYVLELTDANRKDSVDRMVAARDEIMSTGQISNADLSFIGTSGSIRLNWFPYGSGSYYVLVKPEKEAEVLIRMRYSGSATEPLATLLTPPGETAEPENQSDVQPEGSVSDPATSEATPEPAVEADSTSQSKTEIDEVTVETEPETESVTESIIETESGSVAKEAAAEEPATLEISPAAE